MNRISLGINLLRLSIVSTVLFNISVLIGEFSWLSILGIIGIITFAIEVISVAIINRKLNKNVPEEELQKTIKYSNVTNLAVSLLLTFIYAIIFYMEGDALTSAITFVFPLITIGLSGYGLIACSSTNLSNKLTFR